MLLFAGIAALLVLQAAVTASASSFSAARAARGLTQTATHFTITGATTTGADASQSFVVTALDSSNATVTGYTGTVHFTSTDAHAVLPANYTFVGGDSGVHTFAGVKLESLGSKTITVTDTVTASIKGTTAAIVVSPGAAKTLSVTIPTASVAGATVPVKVTALDGGGNTAVGYTGTVYFTSTDANADLPDDYTFLAGDKGVHTFTATLVTAGTKTVTATDGTTGSITGTSGNDVVAAGTVTHFGISAPASADANTASSVTVTALNAAGGIVPGYTGTVHFTSTDTGATLPADHTFNGGDAGSHTFSVTLNKAGASTITVKDTTTASITGSAKVTVYGTDASALSVSIPTSSIAGQPVVVKVTAVDPGGNTDTGYTGVVHFTSTDGSAVLPGSYTFIAADKGVHTFSATLKTAGTKTITATDSGNSLTGTSGNDVVAAGTVTHLGVTAPAQPTADSSFSVVVTALNQFNAKVVGYTGTVAFTSSDAGKNKAITLPANHTFTGGDAGVHTFAGVKLETAGHQTIKVADTTTASIAGVVGLTVNAGSATALKVTIPSASTAGQTLAAVQVTAIDGGGNVDTGYTGTVTFTSNDGSAQLPDDYTFTNGDNGTHIFHGAILMTAGNKTITATDTTTGSITGTSAADVVAPGVVTHLGLTGASTKVADAAYSLTVTALNAFDAKVTGYTGIVHFTTSDGDTFNAPTLPANYTFVGGDAGSHTFAAIKLETVGRQTITATDTTKATITGTRAVVVTPGAAKTLLVTAPKSVVNTVAFNVTVTARDAGGNTATGYTGAVTFTSTDGSATLPSDYTFVGGDNGKHVFSVTPATAGSKTVTATDKATGSINGTSAAIKVH